MASPYTLHSWSGGKDSALSLHHAMTEGGAKDVTLITAISEDGERTRSHAICLPLMRQQADAVGCKIEFYSASWASYEEEFIKILSKHRAAGAITAYFGDIDLDPNRKWEEKRQRAAAQERRIGSARSHGRQSAVCAAAGLAARLPLWGRDRRAVAQDFIARGFRAVVCCVNGSRLDASFAGREFDQRFLDDLPRGVCPCGEGGEFHTFVYDGPNFGAPVRVRRAEKYDVPTSIALAHAWIAAATRALWLCQALSGAAFFLVGGARAQRRRRCRRRSVHRFLGGADMQAADLAAGEYAPHSAAAALAAAVALLLVALGAAALAAMRFVPRSAGAAVVARRFESKSESAARAAAEPNDHIAALSAANW
ncbi:hypothetical protein JKP88DRAFT_353265 [Tribonema minus]|uniref:Diphthine--ammonia ligase n=1 Tax=Tribonema minus TaxID=303371 RepID=A0A835ZB58_9STRA|nr:hypothetical protein JKP88DRAFT_353265 [Tribonema minus]